MRGYIVRVTKLDAKTMATLLLTGLLSIGMGGLAAPADLARIHEQNHEFELAIEAYERSVEQIEDAQGVFSSDLVEPLTGLGRSYLAIGDYEAADQALRRAQHVAHRNDGVLSLAQLPVIEALTLRYLAEDRALDADTQQRLALYIAERLYGKNSPELLPAIYDVSQWYVETGQYHNARQTLERAVEIIESDGGESDLRLLRPLRMMAKTRRLQGVCCSYKRLERAKEIIESNASATGDTMADLYVALGDAYTASRKEEEAYRYYRQALDLASDTTLFEEPQKIAMSATLDDTHSGRIRYYRVERDPLGRMVPEQITPEEKRAQDHQPPQEFVLPLGENDYKVKIADSLERMNNVDTVSRLAGRPFQFDYDQLRYILPLNKQTREEMASLYVKLDFTVDGEGDVHDVEVIESNAPIKVERLMVRVLRKTWFRPAFANGEPVETRHVQLTQTFE